MAIPFCVTQQNGGGGGSSGDTVGPASSTDNALARWDTTTGKLLQNGLVTESDAGALAGVTLLDVDNLRLDGNALTSTNVNGDITITPQGSGSVIVPATALQIGGKTSSDALLSSPGSAILSFLKGDGSGYLILNAERFRAISGSNITIALMPTLGLELAAGMAVAVSSSGTDATQAKDTGQVRAAAGVWKDTDGGAGSGWRQWAGESYLAANATNATATLANTGLSVTVKNGRRYSFKCILYVSDSTAAEGVQIDFGGGSATATNFRAHVTGFDTALPLNTQVTTLTTPAGAGTFTGAGMIEVHGSLEPSSDGTFAPRFAQNTHAVGTLTLFRGSHLLMWDMP